MPMKCIDQTPPPNARAATISHRKRAEPPAARSRPAKLKLVNEANTATPIDSATKFRSCAIGISSDEAYGGCLKKETIFQFGLASQ